ncbi:hypothetical protein [Stenotrophomonas sp. Marseille-Q4652]|uniref:hypothetical protein n=1 Tax=Stenotrophomonas sp. Marseille-Q4652 TaxID=2866595 RepID=UPI001CE3F0F8|nr:hypothetical protein [Stenotrophomonas sp. Marseille-Q4652]
MIKTRSIDFPVLLVEADTTGVTPDDPIIHIMCVLVEEAQDGKLRPAAAYTGYQEVQRLSSKEAFKAHGIPNERLKGERLDLEKIRGLIAEAGSIVSRSPRFNAKKLHALIPECLEKRWFPYPHRIQNWRWEHFPAMARMAIMCGEVANDGYGTFHHLTELLKIDARSYEVVFDEDGPPKLTVKFGRRKVLECFPEALLKCVEGDRFRFHGKKGYDFVTAYCDSGAANRSRAFRLQTTPSNLALSGNWAYLRKIEGDEYLVG